MGKKTYRIYKNGGQPGKVMNPTAQFLAKAQAGMQQPSEEEMMMMQQQGDPQQMPMARYGGKRKKKKNSYAYGSEMKSEYYTLGGGMPQYGAPNTQSNTGMAVPTSAGMNPNMEMNPKMMNQNPAVSNMNQMDQMNQMNQGMRLGGNIHQYTPNMENIPIFDTEEEACKYLREYIRALP